MIIVAVYGYGKTPPIGHLTAYDNKFKNNISTNFPLGEMQYSFAVYLQHTQASYAILGIFSRDVTDNT